MSSLSLSANLAITTKSAVYDCTAHDFKIVDVERMRPLRLATTASTSSEATSSARVDLTRGWIAPGPAASISLSMVWNTVQNLEMSFYLRVLARLVPGEIVSATDLVCP